MSASIAPQSALLTSWKEIACYLGKGVRTVQRWEQQYGLPVRRPNGKVKGIVHATREDLDRWLQSQWSHRNRELAPAHPVDNIHEPVDHIHKEELHFALQQAQTLRSANRRLLQDLHEALAMFNARCQVLRLSMKRDVPPQSQRLG